MSLGEIKVKGIAAVQSYLREECTTELLDYLDKVGFYTAPAAKSHHGAYPGGLLNHSVEVAKQLRILTDKLGLEWSRSKSPEIVGILHDICKTDDYTINTSLDFLDSSPCIEYNNNKIMEGHGDKSVIMLAGHFALTEEEAQCIQFHMGAFVDSSQWQYYTAAVKRYPNVLYAHTADMIASQILDV